MDRPQPPATHEAFRGARSSELHGHSKKVHAVAWNCTGRKLASGSVDKTIRIWDIHHGKGDKAEAELKGHKDGVDQLVWHPSHPDQLATASGDKSVCFWDTRAAKCVAPVATAGENINIAWSPDGRHVAVGDRGDCVTVLDARTHAALSSTKFDFEVNEFCWDRSGELFFVTSGAGSVEVLRFPGWTPLHTLQAHTGGCYCLALSPQPEGDLLAVGSADALVSLWSVNELSCLRTLSRLDKPIRALSFSHCGRFLASGSQDGFIDVALAESGEAAARIDTRAELNSMAWNPRFHLLAYATGDAQVTDADGLAVQTSSGAGHLRIWGCAQ